MNRSGNAETVDRKGETIVGNGTLMSTQKTNDDAE